LNASVSIFDNWIPYTKEIYLSDAQ
jgi:hypothetical protein